MMNKRRTSEMGKAKYLLFAPLAAALLMVSNIETVAREVSEQVSTQLPEKAVVQENSSAPKNDVALVGVSKEVNQSKNTVKKTKQAQTNKQAKETASKKQKSTATYDLVEEMPCFPGGQGAFMKYVSSNVKYPKSAVEAKKQGTVIIGFVVKEDGSVANPKVLRSIDADLDAEALRVVGASPKWTPGTESGKPVPVKYVVPVRFQIPASKDAEKK